MKKAFLALLVFAVILGLGIAAYGFSKNFQIEKSIIEGREIIAKEAPEIKEDGGATPEGIGRIIDANNKLAFSLYSQLSKQKENIFFSPWSISSAMAIVYEGARGKTEEEMSSVLYLPGEERRPAYARLYNEINKKEKEYELDCANALWAQKDYHFLDAYFDLIGKYYGGKIENLDFISDTEASRKTINEWVEDKTKERIKDLLQKGTIDASTRLVITNAIYFKGRWVKQFDEKNTQENDFRMAPDNTVKVQMMSLRDNKFNYCETGDAQILELPYEGGELSMLILLPKEDNFGVLEDSLRIEGLNEWKTCLKEEEVEVYLPRFKLETKYGLVEIFNRLGMREAFDAAKADFSGMTGRRDLFISRIIHQAFVEVNEEGTEAAAATGVVMTLSAVSTKKVFLADHPFIFIIQQRGTGNILFMGRVVNPTSSSSPL